MSIWSPWEANIDMPCQYGTPGEANIDMPCQYGATGEPTFTQTNTKQTTTNTDNGTIFLFCVCYFLCFVIVMFCDARLRCVRFESLAHGAYKGSMVEVENVGLRYDVQGVLLS